ncbi:MAG: S8 family serine peptidase [Bacteroidales bacterium]|nr:S8 family serine peptidase [Bacteroidales bacterium]
MKKRFLLLILAVAVGFSACQKKSTSTGTNVDDQLTASHERVIPGSYIILYDNTDSGFKAAALDSKARKAQVIEVSKAVFTGAGLSLPEATQVYGTALKGMAVSLTEEQANLIRNQKGVKGVYPDKMVTLAKPGSTTSTPPAEVIPYGVIRTGYTTYTGTHKAWIIDTGIDLDHPDLNVDVADGYLAPGIRSRNGFDDDNGHGSHCAGIVGAIDNEIGVVGVAAGVQVVPVKVLDRRGSGAYSSIIAGIDYVAANATPGDAANLSLGGGAYDPIDQAVQALGEAGIFVAMAAGNETDDANNHSPARANGINLYTVSAMDQNDVFAYFSNYGNPPVDYCAPGVSIYSTYKDAGYATLSGTSMASPHVCGLLLITNGNLKTDGYVVNDPDGNPDPIAHN